ncbi:MAG: hypothetical protein OSB41_09405, partial [Kiritimatiellae bacterium]|nr:hypothetical protein [Kiritimatiellia bacterium]
SAGYPQTDSSDIYLFLLSSVNSAVNLFFSGLKFCKAAWGRGFINIKKCGVFMPDIRPYVMLVISKVNKTVCSVIVHHPIRRGW